MGLQKGLKPKKVIMTIIDSFHPGALQRCLDGGLTPALSFLRERGFSSDQCVSVFPTMTPTCASSIATGKTPSSHQIPGFVWFHRGERRIVNYGVSPKAVLKLGVYKVIQDLLFHLNHKQLSKKVKTIYELLEDSGYSTGAINPYIFRGSSPYKLKVPALLQLASAFRLKGSIWGPRSLYLGSLCPPHGLRGGLLSRLSLSRKFGVNDNYSGTVAAWLIKLGRQPDFLSIYLPDTDGYAHRHDPGKTETSLVEADRQICKVLNSFPSWEDALERNVFIIAGDHSQSLVERHNDSLINLPRLLSEFSQTGLGEDPVIDKDISICPNERMSHIYLLRNNKILLAKILPILLSECRIDQVAWKDGQWYRIGRGGETGRLSFMPGRQFYDIYGQGWVIEGELEVLDIAIRGDRIVYNNYPDALWRLMNILDTKNAGDIIITARQGYEFDGECAPGHRGAGSHGSLHRVDSMVPLFITGSEECIQRPRITDLVPFIIKHFSVTNPSFPVASS